MAVTRDIPQSNDIISVSQGQLLANNQGYVDGFAVDHAGYNDTGAGKHLHSTYPQQGNIGVANPTTSAGEGSVFTANSVLSPGRTDLYYKYQTSAGTDFSGFQFPLTAIKAFGKAGSGAGNTLFVGSSFNVDTVTFSGNTWTVKTLQHMTGSALAAYSNVVIIASAVSSTGISGLGCNIVDSQTFTVTRGAADASGIYFIAIAIG